MTELFLARQPIYDRTLNVHGYEILYRSSLENRARVIDGEQATSQVILDTLMEVGLDGLVGNKLAFVNFTRAFLLTDTPLVLPVGRVVVEVLEDAKIDDDLIVALRNLVSLGYPVALDDFFFREELSELVALASIVKLDILQHADAADLERHVAALRRFPVKLLAEKVETQAQFEMCFRLGFDYFQGYFFCQPRVIKRNRVPANRLNTLRLLSKLQNPKTEFKHLEEIIAQDVTLSYRLLRYINSAFFGLRKKMESVHRAIVYLGYRNIRTWATVIALSGIDDKPSELVTIAMVRARMCELLADTHHQQDRDSYFTVGLFSVLDAMLDQTMAQVLESLPLADAVDAALLQREGHLGETLQCVLDYERGNWEAVEKSGFDSERLKNAYLQAIAWANSAIAELKK